jgi:membrane protein
MSHPAPGGSWRRRLVLVRDAVARFREHDMTYHAAALTYYSLMALFPGLLVGVVLLGLIGQQSTVDHVAHYLTQHGAPKATVDAVRSSLRTAVNSRAGSSTALLVVGLGLALYGASGAFGAAGKALDAVVGKQEGPGFVRRKLTDLGSTLLLIALTMAVLVMVFLGGGVAHQLFGAIGLGHTAATLWNVVRWPAAIAVAMLIYSYVYAVAPSGRRPMRWFTPGSAAAVLLWVAASAAFFVYVANFGSYNATYGAFAAVVILLVWLWLSNVALLLGAELNAAVDRARAASAPRDASTGPRAPGRSRTAAGAGGR